MSSEPPATVPRFTDDDAKHVITTAYGAATITKMGTLPSYDDKNFAVEFTNKEGNHQHVVLKVSNIMPPANVVAQLGLVEGLFRNGVPVPRPVPHVLSKEDESKAGLGSASSLVVTQTVEYTNAAGEKHQQLLAMCAIEFIENSVTLEEHPTPCDSELVGAIGKASGQFSHQMQRVSGASAANKKALIAAFTRTSEPGEVFVWDTANAVAALTDDKIELLDVESQAAVRLMAKLFSERIAPHLGDEAVLPRSLIHGDLNTMNILVTPPTSAKKGVLGLIDFGDTTFTNRIFDAAHLVSYLLLFYSNKAPYDTDDEAWLEMGLYTPLREFVKEAPLNTTELELVFLAALTRASISICMSALGAAQDPDNAEYILLSAQQGKDSLKRVAKANAVEGGSRPLMFGTISAACAKLVDE